MICVFALTGCAKNEVNNESEVSKPDDPVMNIYDKPNTGTTIDFTEVSEDVSGEDSLSGEEQENSGEENAEETLEEPLPFDTYLTKNSYDALSVPTWVTYYDGLYFIVDCYHNQVLYSETMDKPLTDWYVMYENIGMGHVVVSDGAVYLVDDTENNRVLVFCKRTDSLGGPHFYLVQTFENVGDRPHYIQYDEKRKIFYVWNSMSGELVALQKVQNKEQVQLVATYKFPELDGVYVRSFSIIDDKIYFTAGVYGNCTILEVDYYTFEAIREIEVAPELGGMVQMAKIGDYYYITVSTDIYGGTDCRTILRTDSLDHLHMGEFEDMYYTFTVDGTPYNISQIDDTYYLTIHRWSMGPMIVSFGVENNQIVNLTEVY